MYCCPAERGRNGRFGSSRHVTSGSFGQRQQPDAATDERRAERSGARHAPRSTRPRRRAAA